ncbi:MAG: hypothetical protein KJ000_24715 [Pirellulaceae bacterium]|jgi:hypothetical protein|nr:hypothetical protein [Pirellulaceae bacterium]
MKSCDLLTGLGRLQRSTSQLKEKWLETKTHWNDQASRDFEKDFLQGLAPQITLAVAAIHQYAELLEQVEKDLADPDRDRNY